MVNYYHFFALNKVGINPVVFLLKYIDTKIFLNDFDFVFLE